jgi:hypothetical protein
VHVSGQLRQGGGRGEFHRFNIADGFAGGAERLVDGMGQGVNGRRLAQAGDDQGGAPLGAQIGGGGLEPAAFGRGDRLVRVIY